MEELEKRIEALEKRAEALERDSHSVHTLSSEFIDTIAEKALQKMNDHVRKLFRVGTVLLRNDDGDTG